MQTALFLSPATFPFVPVAFLTVPALAVLPMRKAHGGPAFCSGETASGEGKAPGDPNTDPDRECLGSVVVQREEEAKSHDGK